MTTTDSRILTGDLSKLNIFRTCRCCGRKIHISRFTRNKACKFGFSYTCKECYNKRQKEFREQMKQKVITKSSASYPVTDNLSDLKIIKTCKCCGNQLPLSCFGVDKSYKDGYCSTCKNCKNKQQRERAKKKKAENIDKNEMVLKLEDFTDQAIFIELKRRGYSGELSYSRSVDI